MATYTTSFGSLHHFDKGGVDIIDDDPRHYAFSNVFDVANRASPWEKVMVARNQEYVLEVIRAEGTSGWRSAAHDEFALVMDGVVTIELWEPLSPQVPPGKEGSIALDAEPPGRPMGRIVASRGHMALLPAGAAYRMHADAPSVVLLQTIAGDDTVARWSDICQTI
jgi:hypothetical protein